MESEISTEVLQDVFKKIANGDCDEASVGKCRVWGYAAYRTTEGMEVSDILYYSPRAGGFYKTVAESDNKDSLFTIADGLVEKPLPPLQQAILTTWIAEVNKNSESYNFSKIPMLTEKTVKKEIASRQPIDYDKKKEKILKHLTHFAGVGKEFPVVIGDIAESPLTSYKDERINNLTNLLIASESESSEELNSFLENMDGREINIIARVPFKGEGEMYTIKLNAIGKRL